MNPLNIMIRRERPDDYDAVLRLTYEAFLTLDHPGKKRMDEHYLYYLLQDAASVIPELCFVAEHENAIVGHILYTKSGFKRPDGSEADTVTFGPLSVLPKYHRRGIGTALVRHSMEKAREMGFKAVLIMGVPEYYPKLGFKRAREYDLVLADGSAADAYMGYELVPDYLNGGGAHHGWAPEFELTESGGAGYEAFHRRFMRSYFPGQLTLRPVFDNDIFLMERWLRAPHVARWYRHPGHWLRELRERRGEFSFLTQFIAEYEGAAIGFCQYYDCQFSQRHEVWNDERPVRDKQDEIYSMDCLIGEPEYMRRGFGKEMVRLLLEDLRGLGAKEVVAQTDEGNEASRRLLLAHGFTKIDDEYSFKM